MSEVSKPHSEQLETRWMLLKAHVEEHGTHMEVLHELLERVVGLEEQLEAEGFTLEVLRNGCEQALLLLDRDRFEDDPEAKVVRAVLRNALASNPAKSLDDIDPKDLGDGMEATVEPGDEMTEADLEAFDPASSPHEHVWKLTLDGSDYACAVCGIFKASSPAKRPT